MASMKAKGASQPTPPAAPPAADKVEVPKEPVYSYESRLRCPRCQAPDTKVRDTKDPTRYMECTRAVCRHKWSVKGRSI